METHSCNGTKILLFTQISIRNHSCVYDMANDIFSLQAHITAFEKNIFKAPKEPVCLFSKRFKKIAQSL